MWLWRGEEGGGAALDEAAGGREDCTGAQAGDDVMGPGWSGGSMRPGPGCRLWGLNLDSDTF